MIPRVIFITDPSYSLDHTISVVERAASALAPGVLMVQLRDKTGTRASILAAATRLRRVTRDAGALFSVNTIRKLPGAMLDIAEEVGADGVHVECTVPAILTAKTAMSWVSVPSHSEAEARTAHSVHASAVLVSPIFITPGKGMPRGVPALIEARRFRVPVYALGGVTTVKAQVCAEAGAHGVAVIRALLGAEDPAKVALELAKPFLDVAEDV